MIGLENSKWMKSNPGARDKIRCSSATGDTLVGLIATIAYIGDDLCDLECMRRFGVAFSLTDAGSGRIIR